MSRKLLPLALSLALAACGGSADALPSTGDATNALPSTGEAADARTSTGDATDALPSTGDATDARLSPEGATGGLAAGAADADNAGIAGNPNLRSHPDPGSATPHPAISTGADTIPLAGVETPEDWAILRQRVEWARLAGLDTVPLGQTIAALGRTFVGAPYTPGTLEAPGPEALVVNLREFDCVTFVESVVALAWVARDPTVPPDNREMLRAAFAEALASMRYRSGSLNGYSSRLHYFSEWISDNAARGSFQNLTSNFAVAVDSEPIDFMSTHPDAYRQLAEPEQLAAIQAIESKLNEESRWWIPEDRIGDFAHLIQDGDVIAATSTVEGLDIAHTGIALWINGELHLMHAPLVGKSVEISERPLADRIQGFSGQDGIMVARPLDRP